MRRIINNRNLGPTHLAQLLFPLGSELCMRLVSHLKVFKLHVQTVLPLEQGLLDGLLQASPDLLEDLPELGAHFFDAQPDEPEGTAVVEYDDENDLAGDQGDVEVVLLSLVEMDGELLFADELCESPGRGDGAGSQGREAGGVDALAMELQPG